jgi:hypothetical protein
MLEGNGDYKHEHVWESGGTVPGILNRGIKCEWPASRLRRFIPGERPSGIH